MQERALLQVALGLAEPWRAARIEFSAQECRSTLSRLPARRALPVPGQ
jgi:hypothetical protein